jgi:phospholipid/cholesterol/gamma-HCH transport system permease protein
MQMHISHTLTTAPTPIGRGALRFVGNLGAMAVFFVLALVNIFRRKQLREIVNQVFYIGVRSSLIVLLVGLFTGMVLGLQLFYSLVRFGSAGPSGLPYPSPLSGNWGRFSRPS